MGISIFDEKQPYVEVAEVSGADDVWAASWVMYRELARRVDAMIATSRSVTDQTVQVVVKDGLGNQAIMGEVTIPAGAGAGAVAAVDIVAGLVLGAPAALIIPPLGWLSVDSTTSLESGVEVTIAAIGGLL